MARKDTKSVQGMVLLGAYWWVPQAGLQILLGEGPLQFNVGTVLLWLGAP